MAIKRPVPIVFVTVFLAVAAVFLPRLVASREPTRELLVVARGMTYYVDGASTANPELQFAPGERVHLVFRNEDKGMLHDFGIPAWRVSTGLVAGGSERSIEFKVPAGRAAATSATYHCTPHSAMMTGAVTVRR
jgi:hypothetical protein